MAAQNQGDKQGQQSQGGGQGQQGQGGGQQGVVRGAIAVGWRPRSVRDDIGWNRLGRAPQPLLTSPVADPHERG
jgi:hypothetical protein